MMLKAFITAFVIFFCHVIYVLRIGVSWKSDALQYISVIFFLIGFFIYLKNLFTTEIFRKHIIFKWKSKVLFFHLPIWFCSFTWARKILEDALGVPYDGFESSVLIISLMVYPFFWILGLVLFLLLMLTWFLILFSWNYSAGIIGNFFFNFKKIISPDATNNQIIFSKRESSLLKYAGNLVAVYISLVIISFFSTHYINVIYSNPEKIRAIAYVIDYSESKNHLLHKESSKFKILKDGYVSYATCINNSYFYCENFNVTVEKIK